MNNSEITISVIMPVYLGDYEGGATDRATKFRRAIDSFVNQTNLDGVELIIVGDGCKQSSDIFCHEYASKYGNLIKYYRIEKQPHFSGFPRSHGIRQSTSQYITYLDSDDILEPTHVEKLKKAIINLPNDYHWMYYNVLILLNDGSVTLQVVDNKKGCSGTCSITHKRIVGSEEINWNGCDGYGHDWKMIETKLQKYKSKKVNSMGYIVCHQPDFIDN